jgi:hypothetical protein
MLRDYDIRNYLYNNNLKQYIDDGIEKSIVLDEWQVGESRIDIGVVNGKITGYELKSKKDTLNRLEKQVRDYLLIFDKLYLVIDETHRDEVMNMVPFQVGIMIVSRRNISTERPAEQNHKIDYSKLASLLWKDEMIEVLSETDRRGFKSKCKTTLAKIIAEEYGDETKTVVRERIKDRYCRGWRRSENSQAISSIMSVM